MADIISFKKEPIKFDIYGEVYALNKPTYGQIEDLQEKIEEAKDNSKLTMAIMRKFLAACGLEAKTIRSLEPEHLNEIISVLSGTKKKT